jgi:hypothetical protein
MTAKTMEMRPPMTRPAIAPLLRAKWSVLVKVLVLSVPLDVTVEDIGVMNWVVS